MPRLWADWVGEMLLPRISMGKLSRKSLWWRLIPMSKNSVLSGFNFNLFLYIQSLTETSEFWRFCLELSKLDVLKELCICVSSMYRWCLISSALRRRKLRGIEYIVNSSHPSTESKGTPKMSSMGLDLIEEIWTDWNDVGENWQPVFNVSPPRPNHSVSLFRRIWGSIVSNAPDKSRSVRAVTSPFSIAANMSSWTERRAVSVEW